MKEETGKRDMTPKNLSYQGTTYNTFKDLARAINVPLGSLAKYIEKGINTGEEILDIRSKTGKNHTKGFKESRTASDPAYPKVSVDEAIFGLIQDVRSISIEKIVVSDENVSVFIHGQEIRIANKKVITAMDILRERDRSVPVLEA